MHSYTSKPTSSLKFSIITATYNSAETIVSCLDSIASQTYQNIEHIIIDSDSSDDTLEKIKKHSFKHSRIISEIDDGIYDALNKGIKNSTGDIIGFLHSDDFFSNNKVIENIVGVFENNSSISAVYGDCEFFSKANSKKTIRRWQSRTFNSKLLKNGWMPPHAALYLKKEVIESIQGFDTSYKISGDYMCILKIFSKANFKAHYIPKVLLKMRMGGASNRSFLNIFLKTKEDWRALRENNFGFFLSIRALFLKNISKIVQFF